MTTLTSPLTGHQLTDQGAQQYLLDQLFEQAYRDELTGLFNRRALSTNWFNYGDRYAVVIFDLDSFKALNDSHGHAERRQVPAVVR